MQDMSEQSSAITFRGLEDLYIGDVLVGAGGYATVALGLHVPSQQIVAVKRVERARLGGISLLRALDEKEGLLYLQSLRSPAVPSVAATAATHPAAVAGVAAPVADKSETKAPSVTQSVPLPLDYFVKLYDTLKDDENLYFVTERIRGWDFGTILEYIEEEGLWPLSLSPLSASLQLTEEAMSSDAKRASHPECREMEAEVVGENAQVEPPCALTLLLESNESTTSPQQEQQQRQQYAHSLGIARGLPAAVVLRVVRHMCAALSFLHSLGIAHRDVKPKNIMWTIDGTIKLIDFGSMRWKHSCPNTDSRCITAEGEGEGVRHEETDGAIGSTVEPTRSSSSKSANGNTGEAANGTRKRQRRRDSFAGTPHYLTPLRMQQQRMHQNLASNAGQGNDGIIGVDTKDAKALASHERPNLFGDFIAQDWWALGLTAFELWAGTPLFSYDRGGPSLVLECLEKRLEDLNLKRITLVVNDEKHDDDTARTLLAERQLATFITSCLALCVSDKVDETESTHTFPQALLEKAIDAMFGGVGELLPASSPTLDAQVFSNGLFPFWSILQQRLQSEKHSLGLGSALEAAISEDVQERNDALLSENSHLKR